ncbi:TPA: hypothetical protein N0F65_007003 [Lagenidium giganteum]|uniref:Multiple inositol polyphosphate phosphatase 1 n=1 Tax=Lagenidium giganteum TaxID=4803 RepID=A0AAV2ZG04_9STRA|nr:TPA: hypothetical protein N0F65_007003 [Lagenidium giganteum]
MIMKMTRWIVAMAAVMHVATAADAKMEKSDVLRTRMSTKTIYPVPTETEQAEDSRSLDECTPIQLNFVVRHGTRFPTIKDIKRISATHTKIYTLQSPPETSWVARWMSPFDPARAGWLAEAGTNELIAIGQRLRQRYGQQLQGHFEKSKFIFEHTWKPRTQQSAMAFAYGFFGSVQPVHYETDPIGQDHELRFFDNCPAFDVRIENNKSATVEHARYRTSAQMQRSLERFRAYVGGPRKHELDQRDLEAAYAGCAFDYATQGLLTDEWCSLFDEEMLRTMDYFHDLKHFYKKSHGHALAYEIASPLLQDMFQSMKQRVARTSDVEGHFRFAHAETILPLASLLNLSDFDRHVNSRDGHFLASTPLEVAERRVFKGAVLAPFAANIGFVLYECLREGQRMPGYGAKLLLNERVVRLPECNELHICPLERLEAIFHRWLHEYDFAEQCTVEAAVREE